MCFLQPERPEAPLVPAAAKAGTTCGDTLPLPSFLCYSFPCLHYCGLMTALPQLDLPLGRGHLPSQDFSTSQQVSLEKSRDSRRTGRGLEMRTIRSGDGGSLRSASSPTKTVLRSFPFNGLF